MLQVLQDCLGLKSWSGGSICYPLFAALTGWLVWILAGFTPYTAARLLQTSTLQHADYALVKVSLPEHICTPGCS